VTSRQVNQLSDNHGVDLLIFAAGSIAKLQTPLLWIKRTTLLHHMLCDSLMDTCTPTVYFIVVAGIVQSMIWMYTSKRISVGVRWSSNSIRGCTFVNGF